MDHSARFHSKLSPSGAKRFMACPGSVKLSEGFERKDSVFSAEGTAAHELAEHCLTTGFDPVKFKGMVVDLHPPEGMPKVRHGDARPPFTFPIDDDMIHAVEVYVEHVRWFWRNHYEVSLEERVYLTDYVAGMSGTADCLAYSEQHRHLFVIDYKHGRGVPVEANDNPQLLCYALGALKRYGNRTIEHVTLTIVQPRASHPRGAIRSWETTPEYLRKFSGELMDAALLALSDDAPLNPGEHCQFCPAAPCKAMTAMALETASQEFETVAYDRLSPEETGELLRKVGAVETWCRKVREYANEQARNGNMPAGHKWVEKRATRKWGDEQSVADNLRLVMDFDDEQIFERKLKSPPAIEKLVGKKNFQVLRPLVVQQSSGLVLAPEEDPRPGISPNAAAEFEDVSEQEE